MISKLYAFLLPLIAFIVVVVMIAVLVWKIWTWMARHFEAEPAKQNIEQVEHHPIFDL